MAPKSLIVALGLWSVTGCADILDLDAYRDATAGGSGGTGAGSGSGGIAGQAGAGGCGEAQGGDSPYASAVLQDLPIAYWRLGEHCGTTAFNETVHPYAGSYELAVTLGAAGLIAGDTDAAVLLQDEGHVGVPAGLDFSATAAFTLEAWVSLSKLDYGVIVETATSFLAPFGDGYVLYVDEVGNLFFVRVVNDVKQGPSTSTPLGVGVRHHVVATYNGNIACLDVDALPSICDVMDTRPLLRSGVGTRLGISLSGALDEVAIYPHALFGPEIANHHAIGTGN